MIVVLLQHGIAASPAPCTSVPTPSTMNVQSPASVLNPGSVGAPAASPASLNPAEEQAYLDKVCDVNLVWQLFFALLETIGILPATDFLRKY